MTWSTCIPVRWDSCCPLVWQWSKLRCWRKERRGEKHRLISTYDVVWMMITRVSGFIIASCCFIWIGLIVFTRTIERIVNLIKRTLRWSAERRERSICSLLLSFQMSSITRSLLTKKERFLLRSRDADALTSCVVRYCVRRILREVLLDQADVDRWSARKCSNRISPSERSMLALLRDRSEPIERNENWETSTRSPLCPSLFDRRLSVTYRRMKRMEIMKGQHRIFE